MGRVDWKQVVTAIALIREQDNTQGEKSELNRKDVCVMSLHTIHNPLGTDYIVQSLGERNGKAGMESWGDTHHLDVEGGKSGWIREPDFLGSL